MAPVAGWSNAKIISQLDTGLHWTIGSSTGQLAPTISYGFTTSADWFPTSSFYGETVGWSAMNAKQMAAAREVMQLWDDLIAADFVEYVDGPAPPPNQADIRFSNTDTAIGYAHAYLPGVAGVDNNDAAKASGSVWMNGDASDLRDPDRGEYGYMAFLHEVGHTLGLDHPGAYNGGSPTYAANAEYVEDTWMYTVMSYFSSANTGADWVAANGRAYYAQTPMLHDVMAIQAMYGAETTTRTGDTCYGFNSTADRTVFNFSVNTNPILTIWDAGGNDTLDLSGWSTSCSINLQPGTYSSANAMTRNIAIAYGAWLENANGGGGNDAIAGNELANVLKGFGGADNLTGLAGDDWLDGGAGRDLLLGGDGNDILVFDSADMAGLDGGLGFDSLLFYTELVEYDLAAHGLEQAMLVRTGTAGGAWSSQTDYYDLQDRLTKRETSFGNGTSSIELWDIGDQESWSKVTRTYAANGALTGEVFTPDGEGGSSNPTGSNRAPTDITLSGASVSENAATGALIGNLSAIDPDSNESFRFSLLNDAGGRFRIDGNRLVVANATLLDYETTRTHQAVVRVTDSGGKVFEETLTITVLDAVGVTRSGTSAANTLTGTNEADRLNGLAGNDTLNGLAGNDILDGGTGSDKMSGGAGDDTYYVNATGDSIAESAGAGIDTAITTVTLTLAANVEAGTLSGTSALSLTGNALDNVLTGNSAANNLNGGDGRDKLDGGSGNDTLSGGAGDDQLNGGAGDDRMSGGLGNDIYQVNAARDSVTESANQGTDEVQSSVAWVLGSNVEKLLLLGTGNIAGTGNSLANTITGNSGANTLSGQDGADILIGAAGNDQLNGGAGNDLLLGGLGLDQLTGGLGADSFLFAATEGLDRVTDFQQGSDHLIFNQSGDMPSLDQMRDNLASVISTHGDTFVFVVGSQATSNQATVIYNPTSGVVSFDSDGTGSSAGRDFAQLATGLALSHDDIVVI